MNPSHINISLLRPSAIGGLIRLRRELKLHPGTEPREACRLLSATYANAGMDFEGALALHEGMPTLPIDVPSIYREIISVLIRLESPPWLSLFSRGREAVVAALDPDARTCFERAGALVQAPDDLTIQWLDALVSMAYARMDADRLKAGREAEKLSFERERLFLSSIEDSPPVQWVSLDDNGAGYDLLSYVLVENTLLPQFIEVKSSASCPPRIYVTRHEWDVATSMDVNYKFHVWHLPTGRLREYSVAEVAEHMPIERGSGRWEIVQVSLPDKVSQDI